jgi:endonuclease/exonuclease/phosphatase (EEP) superfamily protein YafD
MSQSAAEQSTAVPAPPTPTRRFSVLNVCTIGLFLVTSSGSLGAWHWALDLSSHFRCYYSGFAVLVAIGVWRQKSRLALATLALVLIWNGLLIVPYYVPVRGASSPTTPSISLVSLNVHTSNADKAAVVNYLRKQNPDLILVMEIDNDWTDALHELRDQYPHRLMQPRPDNFGIGLLSKLPLNDPRVIDFVDTENPSVVAGIELAGISYQVIGTHPIPPAGDGNTRERNAQLRAVADYVAQSKDPCIVAGDFNATPWSSAFRDLTSRSGLTDSALGHGIQSSWNARSLLMRIPIDHVLVPKSLAVNRRAIGPDVGSDHYPVEATLSARQ